MAAGQAERCGAGRPHAQGFPEANLLQDIEFWLDVSEALGCGFGEAVVVLSRRRARNIFQVASALRFGCGVRRVFGVLPSMGYGTPELPADTV